MSLLSNQMDSTDSLVCIGLDTDYKLIPHAFKRKGIKKTDTRSSVVAFNKEIIDATADLVSCYKFQIAYYAAEGNSGLSALRQSIHYLNKKYPQIPVILDAKRNDIGETAQKYAAELFDVFGADAVTLNPYLGREAYSSFLDQKDKGLFFLCHTSNPGADEFQELLVEYPDKSGSLQLFQVIALNIASKWNENGNCGLVIGATYPEQLASVRNLVGNDIIFLIPGIGAQGGDIEATVKAGKDTSGRGMIISSSRSIIYSSNKSNFGDVARKKTIELRNNINRFR